ncbi:MAG: UDP-N-acetylglucosamine 1-carboxyvinyltransferase, partial [Anaerovoracaceae bacterium]
MGIYRIKGGKRLYGQVDVSGAKNAVLPIIAASVMTKGENCFDACPDISDVDSMLKILKALGCKTGKEGSEIFVDATNMTEWKIPAHLMREMRSSVFLAGSLLSRFGRAVISHPGGCNIGKRPIDIHIKGLEQLGARVETRDND